MGHMTPSAHTARIAYQVSQIVRIFCLWFAPWVSVVLVVFTWACHMCAYTSQGVETHVENSSHLRACCICRAQLWKEQNEKKQKAEKKRLAEETRETIERWKHEEEKALQVGRGRLICAHLASLLAFVRRRSETGREGRRGREGGKAEETERGKVGNERACA